MNTPAPDGYEWVRIPTFRDCTGEMQYLEVLVRPEHKQIMIPVEQKKEPE